MTRRLTELARVAARVAEGGVRARDGQPAEHAVHCFIARTVAGFTMTSAVRH
jgi:hypothetical protein